MSVSADLVHICEKLAKIQLSRVTVIAKNGTKVVRIAAGSGKQLTNQSMQWFSAKIRPPITSPATTYVTIDRRLVKTLNSFFKGKEVEQSDHLHPGLATDTDMIHHLSMAICFVSEALGLLEKSGTRAEYDYLKNVMKNKGLVTDNDTVDSTYMYRMQRAKVLDDSYVLKKLLTQQHDAVGVSMRTVSSTELARQMPSNAQQHSAPSILPESRVLVLYTGGTIGMKSSDGDYCPVPGYLSEVLRDISSLNDRQYVEDNYSNMAVRPYSLPPVRHMTKRVVYWIVEYEPLLDSCDMTFDDWVRIATDIKKAYHKYDGFVVLHGTDTLAYTASALSFMMENLGKPVIVTGSQIPVAEVRSDGMENLIGALITAGNFDIPEVCVYFNNKLMRGNRTVKLDNSALEAFDSPNMHPIAQMAINIKVHYDSIFRSDMVAAFTVCEKLCRNVGMLRIFPSMTIESVRAFLQPPTRGVILQTYGSGNMPTRRQDIILALKEAINRGVMVVNCSQCLKGQVDVNYATGKILYDIGVIPGSDMTSEAAMAKLCYVLGKDEWGLPMQRKMLQANLRGEMTTNGAMAAPEIAYHIAKYRGIQLCQAVYHNDMDLLKRIHAAGIHMGEKDYDNRTALHVAVSLNEPKAVAYLLQCGLDPNEEDDFGMTPIGEAKRRKLLDIKVMLRK